MTHFNRRRFLGTSMALAVLPLGALQARDPVVVPATAVRRGVIAVHGKRLAYRAEAGEIVIRDSAGIPRGTMFAVSYLAEKADPTRRPVTFIWNGGPGAASFLFREQLAPRCTQSAPGSPGYTFQDNPDSVIDASDLVFIDAPGTGYSRVLEESARAEFWGIEQDGRAFTQFIAEWLRIHKREASPKYIMGESYGGTRAGQVARDLAARAESIPLTGVILVSAAFSSNGLESKKSAALGLPSQAASAWANGRGAYASMPLEEVVNQARQFADGPLAEAMINSGHLNSTARVKVADQVSAFTGLCREVLLDEDLIIPFPKILDLLLADQGERLSGYDGREHHPRPPPDAPVPLMRIPGPPPEALIREDIGYRPLIGYQRDHEPIIAAWNNTVTREPSELPVIMKALMAENERLKVLLVGGYFDLAVPYARPQEALLAAGLPESRFHYHAYPTGHSVYADKVVGSRTRDDLRKFYQGADPRAGA
jgi:carboxypeptidase C (cathepsin A)